MTAKIECYFILAVIIYCIHYFQIKIPKIKINIQDIFVQKTSRKPHALGSYSSCSYHINRPIKKSCKCVNFMPLFIFLMEIYNFMEDRGGFDFFQINSTSDNVETCRYFMQLHVKGSEINLNVYGATCLHFVHLFCIILVSHVIFLNRQF